jgi:hypothetical protein
MIAQHLTERVRAGSFFASVFDDQSHVATDFVLTGSLERFEEVDEGRSVAARVHDLGPTDRISNRNPDVESDCHGTCGR